MDKENWYAIFVICGNEISVKESIENNPLLLGKKIKAIVPKRKIRERKKGQWEDVDRIVFPGYVLLNGKIGMDEYYLIKQISKVIKVLRDKDELLTISPKEMELIIKILGGKETIEISNAYSLGNKITIIDGPLYGMEGMIQSVDKRKGRVKVRVDFCNQEKVIDLSINILKKI